MKRLLPLPFLLLTALAACDRLEPVSIPGGSDKQIAGVETVSVSFEQNVNDEPGTKADVAGNGRTTWSEGDRIAYCITEADGSNPAYQTTGIDLDESAVSMFIPQGHKRAHFAIYPASAAVDGHYDAPWVEYPNAYDLTGKNPATWAPAPMVAANAGGQMKFYHVGGLLHLRIVGVYDDGIDEIAVIFLGSGDAPFRVTGHYSVSNAASASATLTAQGEGSNVITFTGLADASAFSDKTGLYELNIPVPALADYSALQQIRVDLKQGGAVVHTFSYAVGGKWSKFLRARGRTAGLALHGLSVAPGKQVVMARGNLQATYDGSAWSWAFAEHQWDYIGADAGNTSINGNGTLSSNGTVDLFGWSTAATTLGIHNAQNYADYSGVFADWGSNANVQAGIGTGWSMLSRGEWNYLFNSRNVNGGTGYTSGQSENDVLGVVIYPDNYTGSTYTTGSNWATFEAAGCVFLPAAGYREGTSVTEAGTSGRYWAETSDDDSSAHYVYFTVNGLYINNMTMSRDAGLSVRLVRNAN